MRIDPRKKMDLEMLEYMLTVSASLPSPLLLPLLLLVVVVVVVVVLLLLLLLVVVVLLMRYHHITVGSHPSIPSYIRWITYPPRWSTRKCMRGRRTKQSCRTQDRRAGASCCAT
jgi:hypothetical protein